MAAKTRPARAATERLTPREGRKFALTLAAAFAALAALLWWRGHAAVSGWLLGVAGALVLAGLAAPGHLGPVHRGWMGLAHAISRVTTPLFMGIVYFVVLTPTGLLRRAFGGNPLRHGAGRESCWARRETPGGDLERQF